MALLYAGLGSADQALQWLEKGRQQQDPWMAFLEVDPTFDWLRGRLEARSRQTAKGVRN